MKDFTHFDEAGASRMVDVGEKPFTSARPELQPVCG